MKLFRKLAVLLLAAVFIFVVYQVYSQSTTESATPPIISLPPDPPAR
jgi:hypothetical protein